ncbi:MAG: helix-turn-helix transcriptional regulator [Clostridia bacterium]|nr:helix-turn-helix transcriptional regulator [Clostridia bacterium]
MPKLKGDPDEEALKGFQKAVRVALAEQEMHQKELAAEVGVEPSWMSRLLAEPGNLSADRLRKIVRALGLDPGVVLRFLGYGEREIKKFKTI